MKCSQMKCDEPASYTYVWPGRAGRSWACPGHMLAAARIAEAGGFTLGDARLCTLDEYENDRRKRSPL
jgi:hypothetical protein